MKLKTGTWTKKSRKSNVWTLRLSETNLLVGYALTSIYDNHRTMTIYAFFHDPYNTVSESVDIPTTDDVEVIHKEWEKCMEKLLSKMFE